MTRSLLACALVLALGSAKASGWRERLGQVFGRPAAAPAVEALAETEIVAALREALAQGTTRAINQLGRTDGFWADTGLRVPLPPLLARNDPSLRRMGFGPRLDEFHLTVNRAAEQAVPQAAELLGEAIRQMSVADAQAILKGEPDAATRYFERVSGPALRARFLPVVREVTQQVGVTQQYRQLTASAGPILQLAGRPDLADLDGHVTDRALAGLFTVMAAEERRIRENPAARGSELLRRVFGAAERR